MAGEEPYVMHMKKQRLITTKVGGIGSGRLKTNGHYRKPNRWTPKPKNNPK